MRNKLYKILAAGIALAMAFTLSCSDDKDDGNPNGGGGSNLSDLPKQTYLDDGSEYKGNSDITLRIQFEEASGYESKPAGKIENGNVSLSLPENIDSKYLRRIKDVICREGNECSVSPENLTEFSPEGLYVSVSGNSECRLLPALKMSGDVETGVNLSYMSQSGKITGKECWDNEECRNYDMNFSKGWNVLYLYKENNTEYITTDLSKTGGTLEWQIRWCR